MKDFGYSLETHEVTTEDGYILTHHRLPRGRNASGAEPIGVVFFNNGILLTSSVVLSYPEGFGKCLFSRKFRPLNFFCFTSLHTL